jgi:hypothetical protein
VALVLLAIGRLGVREQLLDDRDIGTGAIPGGVGGDLGAIDRDHPHPHQPGLRAQRKHLHEHLAHRVLVATAELRDR